MAHIQIEKLLGTPPLPPVGSMSFWFDSITSEPLKITAAGVITPLTNTAGGGVTSVNGNVGPAVILTASDVSAWGTAGNTGTGAEFIGTNNAFGFGFRTNGLDRAGILSTGEFIIGGVLSPSQLQVYGEAIQNISYTSILADKSAFTQNIILNSPADTAFNIFGIDTNITIPLGNTSNYTGTEIGHLIEFNHNGTGTVGSGGNLIFGLNGTINNNDAGNFDTAAGVLGSVNNTSTGGANIFAGLAAQISNTGAGAIATTTGLLIVTTDNSGGGTIGQVYGIDIKDQSGIGITDSYNILSEGATSLNIFEGSIGIKNGAPTAILHVGDTSGGAVGTVRIENGNEGAGKVLTSDALGNADWITSPAAMVNPTSGTVPVNLAGVFVDSPITVDFLGTHISTDLFVLNKLDTSLGILYDTLTAASINWNIRELYDVGAAAVSIAWGSRLLYDASGVVSENWNSRILVDPLGTTSVSWTNRRLFDTPGALSTDWDVRGLYGPTGVLTLDWNTIGRIGINTAAPTEALHVIGNAIVDGKLTVTGLIDPTAIQFSGVGAPDVTKYEIGLSGTTMFYNVPTGSDMDFRVNGVSKLNIDASGFLELNGDPTTALGAVTKQYADGLTVGLLDDRGSFDASVNLYPSTGGSGVAGAILKGDIWYISVAGTLGANPVLVGYSVRALVNTPAQVDANWDILQVGLGYVPENVLNKATTFGTLNNTLYPTTLAVSNFVSAFGYITSVSGTLNRITSTGGATPTIDISASYVGQTSITTLGTITTGVWNGTAITNANLANSTISGKALGTSLDSLTIGTGLSGGGYNGSSPITIAIDASVALVANPLSQFAATTSLQLKGVISDETGSGSLVFGTAPTFTTSITTPLIIGGTSTTQTLTYKTTTGAGAAGADHIFQVGNNGATEAMRILNSGFVGIGTATPVSVLEVKGVAASGGGTVQTLLVNGSTGAGALTINSFSTAFNTYQTFAQGGVAKFEMGLTTTNSDFYINSNTQVADAGASIFIKKSDGYVGIGTVTPGKKLVVVSTDASYGLMQIGNTTSSGETAIGIISGITASGTPPTSVNGDSHVWAIGAGLNTLAGSVFSLYNKGLGGNIINITSAGNMGIGVTAPSASLHLRAGTATASTSPIKFTQTGSALLAAVELGALEFFDNGTIGHLYITVNIAGVPTRVQIV